MRSLHVCWTLFYIGYLLRNNSNGCLCASLTANRNCDISAPAHFQATNTRQLRILSIVLTFQALACYFSLPLHQLLMSYCYSTANYSSSSKEGLPVIQSFAFLSLCLAGFLWLLLHAAVISSNDVAKNVAVLTLLSLQSKLEIS